MKLTIALLIALTLIIHNDVKKNSSPSESLGDSVSRTKREFRVTAYCPCKQCCGKNACGITASGKPVSFNKGRFVAAPKDYSFYTHITIPGYGRVPVLDRGGAIKGNRLDVFFKTHKEALEWGVKYLECVVETTEE